MKLKIALNFLILGGLVACSQSTETAKKISVDGSSTVFPLSEAVVEAAAKSEALGDLRVGVALSGTGGGFKKFCSGEIEVTGASRPIKEVEIEVCKKNGIEFIELPVAYDGLAVVVHPENNCVDSLSVAQLKQIWEPAAEGKITNWNQIDPSCPDLALNLYGPGHDSGTFDYFTEEIVGESKSSRSDFTASEDDNVLVTGVSGDKAGMGYFGFAYYIENKDKLKVIGIGEGDAAVVPSFESIANGSYAPLARPLYIYTSAQAVKSNPHLERFVDFYVAQAGALATEVGYVPLGSTQDENQKLYVLVQSLLSERVLGAAFSSTAPSLKLEQRLKDLL
jgi:phosphate transport system substrate-binding protein